jgi:hypothetical protein
LNLANINEELTEYLSRVDAIKLPMPQGDVLAYITTLKRGVIDSGPYPSVSFFEASNRILSDMVILFGVKRLLTNPVVGNVRLPFTEYEVSFGVEAGNDLRAFVGGIHLIGEAFNVAPSFFNQRNPLL